MFFRTTYADALRVSFTCNSHIWYSSLHDIESIIYWMYKIISNKKHSIYDFFFLLENQISNIDYMFYFDVAKRVGRVNHIWVKNRDHFK